ncbi:MAG: hypothetical protein AMXMBFR84_04220 [Candidatus Hydrogenedentota bacterium]
MVRNYGRIIVLGLVVIGLAIWLIYLLTVGSGKGLGVAARDPLPQIEGPGGGVRESKPVAHVVKEPTITPQGAGVIAGVVLDRQGVPLAGSDVYSLRIGGIENVFTNEHSTAQSVSTDSTGEFRLEGLRWGWYRVSAASASFAASSTVVLSPASPAAQVCLTMRKSGALHGLVVDDTGGPVPRAEIVPIIHDEREIGTVEREGFAQKTLDDGTFILEGVEPLAWSLLIKAQGYAAHVSDAIPVNGPPVTIRLQKGNTLSGIAVDASTAVPVAEWAFEVVSDEVTALKYAAATDESGRFSIESLMPGTYRFRSTHSTYVLADNTIRVEIPAFGQVTPSVTVRLVGGATIRGRVFDASTNEPLADVQVMAERRSSTTDENGMYEITGVPPGQVRVSLVARPRGYGGTYGKSSSDRTELQVASGQVVENVDFGLDRGLTLSGVVVDEIGNGLAGVQVDANAFETRDDGMRFATMSDVIATDANGGFTIANCETGMELYLVASSPMGRSEESGPHRMENAGIEGITLVLSAELSASIAGQTVDGMGRPVRATVIAKHQETVASVGSATQTTDSDGMFVFAGLAPGAYVLTVGRYEPRGLIRATIPADQVTLRAGQSVTGRRLVLDERDSLSIAGFVVNSEGDPVQGANVEAEGIDEDGQIVMRTDISRRDGSYEIIGLSVGEYTVYVAGSQPSISQRNVPAGSTGIDFVLPESE